MARLLDGKRVSKEIQAELKEQVAEMDVTPHLAAVQVGDNPASSTYIRSKRRAAKRIGMESSYHHLGDETTQKEMDSLVNRLNEDPLVHGILVQLPLPRHLDEEALILSINPQKDVDGFHPVSVGRLSLGLPGFVSCTPAGVVELLAREEVEIEGSHVVIVGRSNIVGRPLANLLSQKAERANATVTLCHSRTRDLSSLTRQADILIAAIGRPNFITAEMVSEGQVVIDVGINYVPDETAKKGRRLVGDVDYGPVSEKVEAITPVPGGIGPMTIAMLMSNVVRAAAQFVHSS